LKLHQTQGKIKWGWQLIVTWSRVPGIFQQIDSVYDAVHHSSEDTVFNLESSGAIEYGGGVSNGCGVSISFDIQIGFSNVLQSIPFHIPVSHTFLTNQFHITFLTYLFHIPFLTYLSSHIFLAYLFHIPFSHTFSRIILHISFITYQFNATLPFIHLLVYFNSENWVTNRCSKHH